jgi:glutathione S-transferase
MTIELFVFPPSPNAFKVLAVANQLGIEYTLRFLNLLKGEQKSPQYAALNANMKMPTLREGDFVLWESNAIMQYLASKRPEAGLLPREERLRADVSRWQFWDTAHWHPACAALAFENVVKPLLGLGAPDPDVIERAQAPFHAVARVLDAHLTGRRYVAGDTLTLADFSLGAAMNLAERAQYPVKPYVEMKRWHASLMALPAWTRTLAMTAPPAAAAA